MAEVRPAQKLGWAAAKAQWMKEHPKTRKAAKVAAPLAFAVGGAVVERLGFADAGQFFNVALWLPLFIYSAVSAGLGWVALQAVASPFREALSKEQGTELKATQEDLHELRRLLAKSPDEQTALARFVELREGLAALVEKKLGPHLKNQDLALRKALRAIQSITIELEKILQPSSLAKIKEISDEELEEKLQGKLLTLFTQLKTHLESAGPAIETGLSGLANLGFLLELMGFAPISPEDYQGVVLVGQGGMGDVYRAERKDGQLVALKTCSITDNAQALNRFFKREAPALQRIDHPNIVSCHAYGWTTKDIQLADGKVLSAGTAVLVMDYVSGGDLAGHINSNLSLSVSEAIIFGLQIIDGVSAAHEQGIIHRDLKPANILLDPDKTTVKVTDFGIAKIQEATALTMAGGAIGTAAYMAPEQARGQDAVKKSDLYAIAEIIFEMIAGQALWKHPEYNGIDDLLRAKTCAPEIYLDFVSGRINYFIKSKQLADLLLGALEQNINNRLDMEEFKSLLEAIDLTNEASLGEQVINLTAEAPPSVEAPAASVVKKIPASAVPGPKTELSLPVSHAPTFDNGSDPTMKSPPPAPEQPRGGTQLRFPGAGPNRRKP